MTSSWNPVTVEAIRKALGPDQVEAARGSAEQQQRAALDQAELRDLERAEYYGETAAVIEDATQAASPRRSHPRPTAASLARDRHQAPGRPGQRACVNDTRCSRVRLLHG